MDPASPPDAPEQDRARVLLIGGGGFMGPHVARALIARGHDVTVLTRGRRPRPEGVHGLEADRGDPRSLALALEGRRFDFTVDFLAYDAIDIEAATDLGIAVTITPGTLEESVAEHTIALMLAVTRGIVARDREVRGGAWSRRAMPRMAGKTFGIVGLGRIGRAVVSKVLALGMKVVAHDPCADEQFAASRGVTLLPLEQLLRTADVVSLHSPTTADTRDMINTRTLGLMKQGAVSLSRRIFFLIDGLIEVSGRIDEQ